MIDREKFWAAARPIFYGPNQKQVDGTNSILDEWKSRFPVSDKRWLAYYLATAYWETAHTMQPVREAYYLGEPEPAETYRKKLRYYPYYGRGLVQLTWENNYARQSKPDRTGVDLVTNPDKALEPRTSAAIMFVGMLHGDFGGGGIENYFNPGKEDPEGARHLVNGNDHATEIATIYRRFRDALE